MAGWDYDTGLLYAESKAESNLKSGYPLYSQILPLLDSGVINPFGPTTDPNVLSQVKNAELRGDIYTSKTSTSSFDFRASRDLMQMRSGPLALALGGEYRNERFAFSPSAAFEIGDVAGFGGNILPVDKSRHVFSFFGETSIPILRNLEADIGVRYDNYENVGNTTNPKLSLRWLPVPTLLLRGSYGTGFRAPSLTDLFTPQASSVTANGSRDFLRCPVLATGAPADCNNQFPTITGGQPGLTPEKSKQGTLGIVWEPTPRTSVGIDWYSIFIKNQIVIGGLNFATILGSAANEQTFSQFIVRGAPDGNASGLGPIVDVIQTTSNLFKAKVEGWDLSLQWRPDIGDVGHLRFKLDGSYVAKSLRQNFGGDYGNNADSALLATGGVIPKWRHVFITTYDRGPYELTIQDNYQDSYHDFNANITGTPRNVGAYDTWDLQGRYLGLKNWQFTLGAKNIFDRDPPYTNAGGQFAGGYDISYADVRGRFVYGQARWYFK